MQQTLKPPRGARHKWNRFHPRSTSPHTPRHLISLRDGHYRPFLLPRFPYAQVCTSSMVHVLETEPRGCPNLAFAVAGSDHSPDQLEPWRTSCAISGSRSKPIAQLLPPHDNLSHLSPSHTIQLVDLMCSQLEPTHWQPRCEPCVIIPDDLERYFTVISCLPFKTTRVSGLAAASAGCRGRSAMLPAC